MYCFCIGNLCSRYSSDKSLYCYILGTWYHRSQRQFHLDFWDYLHMIQQLQWESVKFLNTKIRYLRTHLLFLQTSLMQSQLALQIFISSHLGHSIPPQSTSVSSPLFLWSAQQASKSEIKVHFFTFFILGSKSIRTFGEHATISDCLVVSRFGLGVVHIYAVSFSIC